MGKKSRRSGLKATHSDRRSLRGDPKVAEDLKGYMEWLRKDQGVTDLKALPKAQRSELWQRFQLQRWNVEHFFGDSCTGPDGPGHVDTLIDMVCSRSRVEEVSMDEHTNVSFETVALDEIPPERPKPRYAAILQEFLDGGEQAVRLHLWEGATIPSVSGGLRTAATKNGFAVDVATRKGSVYLIRR